MASNSFGKIFRFTTWGESHGKAIGVVIDGCPAGLPITEEEINAELLLRSPGRSAYTSPRKEKDRAEILSGVFENQTTGAPISILIWNQDYDSSKYEETKHLFKPGHANFTYLKKYGIFDYRGGGRASARETSCRVAAGAIAKKIIAKQRIQCIAYIKELGGITASIDFDTLRQMTYKTTPLFCPDENATLLMQKKLEHAISNKDSLGGIVELLIDNVPVGLGDPIYNKFEAILASGMMSIPGSKGFEIGSGFEAARLCGSQHNDTFISESVTSTNHAGGVLGGITTGMPIVARVAFKPTSSIGKEQNTVDKEGKPAKFHMPPGSRHDPCIAIRAVPVVEAMAALITADALLCNRNARF